MKSQSSIIPNTKGDEFKLISTHVDGELDTNIHAHFTIVSHCDQSWFYLVPWTGLEMCIAIDQFLGKHWFGSPSVSKCAYLNLKQLLLLCSIRQMSTKHGHLCHIHVPCWKPACSRVLLYSSWFWVQISATHILVRSECICAYAHDHLVKPVIFKFVPVWLISSLNVCIIHLPHWPELDSGCIRYNFYVIHEDCPHRVLFHCLCWSH